MFIYRMITSILYWILWPFLCLRFKGRERRERFGKTKHKFEKCIWIHAASMGEVNAVKPLINELLNRYPHKDFVLSTMTATGQVASEKISPKLTTIFLPLDFLQTMKRVFDRISPDLIILVETEFWPNMLHLARKREIPVIVVNARISDKSYPRYRHSGFIWKSVWKAIVAVNAQSQKDAQRFENLKFKNVHNAHNLKFCVDLPDFDKMKLRKEYNYQNDDFIIVWGSSRPGEEKLLLKILPELNDRISNLKVIIVPRHLHRIPELKTIFKDQEFCLYTEMIQNPEILIVDEMGILNTFYALADLVVVGGSFVNFGGHNPLEPAFYGKPVIIGNYHHSCRDSVQRLKENYGIVVSRQNSLKDDILKIYSDEQFARNLGDCARRTLKMNSDSLKLNLNILDELIR